MGRRIRSGKADEITHRALFLGLIGRVGRMHYDNVASSGRQTAALSWQGHEKARKGYHN